MPLPTERDLVAAVAADDDVVGAGGDVVDVAGRPRARDVRLDHVRVLADLVQVHNAVVAEDDVRAAALGVDVVGADAAQDHVVAGVRGDVVARAGRCVGVGRLRGEDRLEVVAVDLAVVAEDDRVAGARGDVVDAEAADDDRDAARAGGDPVVAAARQVDRLDVVRFAGSGVVHEHAAVVAEDHVVARGAVDRVAARAADDHVVARAARDRVDVAEVGSGRLDLVDDQVGRAVHVAAVAEDDVRAVAADQRVLAGAADQDRAVAGVSGLAHSCRDRVVATRVGRDRVDVAVEVDEARVAEDDVAAEARGDRVVVAAADHDV